MFIRSILIYWEPLQAQYCLAGMESRAPLQISESFRLTPGYLTLTECMAWIGGEADEQIASGRNGSELVSATAPRPHVVFFHKACFAKATRRYSSDVPVVNPQKDWRPQGKGPRGKPSGPIARWHSIERHEAGKSNTETYSLTQLLIRERGKGGCKWRWRWRRPMEVNKSGSRNSTSSPKRNETQTLRFEQATSQCVVALVKCTTSSPRIEGHNDRTRGGGLRTKGCTIPVGGWVGVKPCTFYAPLSWQPSRIAVQ